MSTPAVRSYAERQCPLAGGAGDTKKGRGVLRPTAAVPYAWMPQQPTEFKISHMCQLLEGSRSGYYEWLGRPPSAHTDAAQQVEATVQ
jgi:hypothetical protein